MLCRNGILVFLIFLSSVSWCFGVKESEIAEKIGETARMYCFEASLWQNPQSEAVRSYLVKLYMKDHLFGYIQKTESNGFVFKEESVPAEQIGRYALDDDGYLLLKNVQYTDAAVYRCEMAGLWIGDRHNYVINFTVYVPPTIEVTSILKTLNADNPEELVRAAQCRALQGNPAATVNWESRHLLFQEDIQIKEQGDGFVTVLNDLMVKPTKYYHNQEFTCTVQHPGLPEHIVKKSYVLNVTYEPDTPLIKVNANHTMLICSSDSNPPASYSWTLPGGKKVNGQSLKIDTYATNNDDNYTCVATNTYNSAVHQSTKTIKLSEAVVQTGAISKSSTTVIALSVIGTICLLALIMGLVYFLLLKPSRTKDPGPYLPPTVRESVRPMIQHPAGGGAARPPSPRGPPPPINKHEVDGSSDDDGSYSDEEGTHDVDIDVNPYTAVVNPAKIHNNSDGSQLKPGITSRASLNFQARRQRPSASPSYHHHRNSQSEAMTSSMKRVVAAPRNNPAPPPRPFSYGIPPSRSNDEVLPPYEGHYSEIDHSHTKPGPIRRSEEPVEYAQIRKYAADSHVV